MQEPNIKFKNEDEAKLASAQFSELKQHPAWTRIYRFMEEKIKFIDFQLREGKIDSIDQLERLRDKRNLAEQFMNLPDIIVEFVRQSGGKELKFDPYSGDTPDTGNKDLDPYAK